MLSYARSLTLVAAVLIATVLALLMTAAPQEGRARPQPPKPMPPLVDRVVAGAEGPPVAPITFADPDGQELILEELSIRTAIHGMLSLTELELRFRNPQERRIEGRFTATLPANAAISRFAKDVNGHLMEGEVVERLRANQVYESFLHQMRDPALLEQDQGNRFSARIFPIEARAPVHLVLSYTQLLPLQNGVRTYAFPLRGMAKVNKLTFRAYVTPIPGEGSQGKLTTSSAEVTSFDETDWTPDRDIVLNWRGEESASRVLRAGDFYLAAIRPNVASTRTAAPDRWTFYVDTSASSAEGAPHRIRALEALLRALPASDRVQLVAFDQDVVPLMNGTASEAAERVGGMLRERLFLGGTDIGALLADVTRKLRDDPSLAIVLASDLVPTVGGTIAPHELKSAIDALPRATIHALILGSREDGPTAKAITAGRGRVIRVPFTDTLTARAREAAADLRRPLGRSIDVADAGAEWLYPSHFDDVQPGDEVIALGKLKAGREPELGGARTVLDSSTFAPLLEREAYRAYLEYLAQREAGESSQAMRRALATEQVRISVEQRVVIPRTTMLVLENEFEYQRFGLDRRALAAILTIDAGGIGRIDRHRTDFVPPPRIAMPVEPMRRRQDGKAEAGTPPPVVSAPAAVSETITVTSAAPRLETQAARSSDFVAENMQEVEVALEQGVEAGVVGGVEGGVVGGVVGGMVGGVPSAAPAPRDSSGSVAETITVTQEAPQRRRTTGPRHMDRPRPVPPPPEKATWVERAKPTREHVASLEKKLRDNPRDRELYNQLSEALAARNEWDDLRGVALRWQPYDPENPQVYEVLGMAASGLGRETEAARAFASLIEIAPAKPELLQRAGLLLLRTRRAMLAEAPLRKALELRPDRANAYRHLALLLWRDGRVEEAARVLESATRQDFPRWYGDVQRVIREELGYVYRAWARKDESRRNEIAQRAREHNVDMDRKDALRITLAWETDANDVDLHVVDPDGKEVFYGNRSSYSGLELYEDIREGLGPEVIRTKQTEPGLYHVGVRYFASGPMGISRGVVVVMRDDALEIHPFRLAKGGEDIRYVTAVKF